MTDDSYTDVSRRFRYFPMSGSCPACDSFETMYVGEAFIDEKCSKCGVIVGGGYLNPEVTESNDLPTTDTGQGEQ